MNMQGLVSISKFETRERDSRFEIREIERSIHENGFIIGGKMHIIFCGNPVKFLSTIDRTRPDSSAHPATCNSMLRSCYRSVGRKASAAIQTRASGCLRSSGRSISAAAALRNGPLATINRRTGPSSLLKPSTEFRMCLSTLTDEELRRKMDTFNDLFVTVGHSECSLANSASSGCWCGDCKKNKKLAVSGVTQYIPGT